MTSLTSSGATGSSPGSYTYGDSAHLHAATSTAGGYSANYDMAGDMVCRAPTSAAICTGASPTGAQLTYDAERRLTHVVSDTSTPPTVEAWTLYDGAGQRVEQAVSLSGGTVATTTYLPGGVEEIRSDGSLVKYYGGLGLNTGSGASTISYTAADGLGSLQVALDGAGLATAQQLHAPYGGVRYASGTMPTAKGFTGQYSDAAVSGLDYYGARYYDPALGQFSSADSVLDSLNRYGYVGDNPTTFTDPTGHEQLEFEEHAGGGICGSGEVFTDSEAGTGDPIVDLWNEIFGGGETATSADTATTDVATSTTTTDEVGETGEVATTTGVDDGLMTGTDDGNLADYRLDHPQTPDTPSNPDTTNPGDTGAGGKGGNGGNGSAGSNGGSNQGGHDANSGGTEGNGGNDSVGTSQSSGDTTLWRAITDPEYEAMQQSAEGGNLEYLYGQSDYKFFSDREGAIKFGRDLARNGQNVYLTSGDIPASELNQPWVRYNTIRTSFGYIQEWGFFAEDGVSLDIFSNVGIHGFIDINGFFEP